MCNVKKFLMLLKLVNIITPQNYQYIINRQVFFLIHRWTALGVPRPLHCWDFEITLRHTTLGRIVVCLWTSDRPVVQTPNLTTHNIHVETDIHAPGGIRTRNPVKRAAADPNLKSARPPGSATNGLRKTKIVSSSSSVGQHLLHERSVRCCHLVTPYNINQWSKRERQNGTRLRQ
jgi:hypothetical protein